MTITFNNRQMTIVAVPKNKTIEFEGFNCKETCPQFSKHFISSDEVVSECNLPENIPTRVIIDYDKNDLPIRIDLCKQCTAAMEV